jgi:predicted dehydrogenase
VIKVGIAGISEENGHPFSFSAIINGFDEERFSESQWPVILKYLKAAPDGQKGIPGARVTHAWTQDPAITAKLCAASKIQFQCDALTDMIGEIDALIIARDDWENHYEMAKPFLESNIPVFVDKPLSLDDDEIDFFIPYLMSGLLMTCSGFRFAKELQNQKEILSEIGSLKLISGVVVNDMNKYGIHLLEAVIGLVHFNLNSFTLSRNNTVHESLTLEFEDGVIFNLDCLGRFKKVFHLSFFGSNAEYHVDLEDNFSAFKKTIEHFLQMVTEKKPQINPQETVMIMRILQTARILSKGASAQIVCKDNLDLKEATLYGN